MVFDEEQWLADLNAADEATVVRALHQACPCSGSSMTYERYMATLHRMKKDARPAVRLVALHLEVDAIGKLGEEDERAQGFVRNSPGGQEKRRRVRSMKRGKSETIQQRLAARADARRH